MVKTASEQAKKYALKFDAYIIMLRKKAQHFNQINKYYEISYNLKLLHDEIRKMAEERGLKWGEIGNLYNFIQKIYYEWDKLSDTQKQYYQDKINYWVLPITLTDDIPFLKTQVEQYSEKCKFPTSNISISLSADEFQEETRINENIIVDYLPIETSVRTRNGSIMKSLLCSINRKLSLTPLMTTTNITAVSASLQPLMNLVLGLFSSENILLENPISKTLPTTNNINLTCYSLIEDTTE